MILGVNGVWGAYHIFQWKYLFLFIPISLCFAGITGKTFYKHYGSTRSRLLLVMPRCEYLRGVISSFFRAEVFREESCMVAVLDRLFTQEVAEVERRISEIHGLEGKLSRLSEQPQVSKHAASLERTLNECDTSAEIADSITRLQRLADEAKQFTRERKFWHLKEVTYLAIKELSDYRKKFGKPMLVHIPKETFETFKVGLATHEESLKRIKSIAPIVTTAADISEKTTRREFEDLAKSVEILAEELEDNLPFLSPHLLELLDVFFHEVVLKSRDKQFSQHLQGRRDESRRRLRFAAGFILNLVETAKEEAEFEDEELERLYLQASDMTA